jgi:hypothetical protein
MTLVCLDSDTKRVTALGLRGGLSMRTACIALIVVGLWVPVAGQREPLSDAEWDWVNTVYERVLQKALPIDGRGGFFLGYRQNRDLYVEQLETSFLYNWTLQEDLLTVTAAKPDSASVYDQLVALHRGGERSADAEVLAPLVRLKHWRLSETSCPAIRVQHDRFYRLRLDMRSEKERRDLAKGVITISMHPLIHHFRADISGGTVDLVVTDQTHEYVGWAEETLRALDACVAAQR